MVEGTSRVRRHEIIGHEVLFLQGPAGVVEKPLEPQQRLDGRLVHEGKDTAVTVLRRKLDLS